MKLCREPYCVRRITIKYRKFGNTDWEASAIGFGFQNIVSDNDDTHEDTAVDMIRYAVDNGVNYIDTGYSADEERQWKILKLTGNALKDGYREKVRIAITLPAALIKSADDFKDILEKQVKTLDAGKVDYCLLGGLNRFTWPRLQKLEIIDLMENAVGQGLFGKPGFYFHDYFQALRDVIEGYSGWAVSKFQYSYMDSEHHPGYGGLKYAFDNGLAVIASEPHLGGRLSGAMPLPVSEVWDAGEQGYSRNEWALRWVLNHGEISTVVSNMGDIEQVKENIANINGVEPDILDVNEKVFISQVRDAYRKLRPVNCTACRACMPCAQGIDAPRIFEIYNDAVMFEDSNTARKLYKEEGHQILRCTRCGTCAVRCGREIAIPEWLEAARNVVEQAV